MLKNYTGISLFCCPFLAPPSPTLNKISYLPNCGVHWSDISCFLFLDIYCLIFQHWKGFTRENDSCKWHTLLKKQSGPKIIPLTRNIYSYVMHLEILVEFRVILNQSMRTRNSNLGTWKTHRIKLIFYVTRKKDKVQRSLAEALNRFEKQEEER